MVKKKKKKNSPAMQEALRLDFNPWVRKIPCRRKYNPPQNSYLGNPVDRGALCAQSMGLHSSWI